MSALRHNDLESFPSHMGDADICFHSPQPDTSLHCPTMDTELVHRSYGMPVYATAFAGTTGNCIYPRRDGQAELTWVVNYKPR